MDTFILLFAGVIGIVISLLLTRWILRIDYSIKLQEIQLLLLIGIAEKIDVNPNITNKIKWELNMMKDKSDDLPKPFEPSLEKKD